MCGIAGCYQQADGQKLVDIMTDRIAHRGPDASGSWSHEDERVAVQLGHRRLSIIDLSTAADQPLSKDGLTLVYNGELYNYRTLRAELVVRGVRFVTESDTEVVLEAWRYWGPEALRRFRGMFAFAIVDERTGELVLARDPLGIKPLYYLRRGAGVAFASELKALVAAVGSELRMEPGALVASMLYYWLPEQRCAIDGVRKLPAARGRGSARTARSRCSTTGGWRMWRRRRRPGLPWTSATVIEESVTAHLVSDVPVSSFLSGGLDSSIVTVLAHQADPAIDAYTITFRPEDQRLEAMPDDAVYARKVAARFGIRLHEIEISPDIVDLLPRIVDVLDEPIGDPAAINTLLMCQAARERGVKVILSGMGADELFGGYRKHLACVLAGQVPPAARPACGTAWCGPSWTGCRSAAAGRGLRYARWAKRFLTFAELPEEPRFRRSYTLYDPGELAALISPDLACYVAQVIEEHSDIYHDNSLPTRSTACAWRTRGCSCPASTSPTPTGRAWRPRSRCASRSSIPSWRRQRSRSTAARRSGGARARSRSSRPPRTGCRTRSRTGPRPRSVPPSARGCAETCRRSFTTCSSGGELVQSGMIRRDGLLRLVQEENDGREDRSKQIWQLLTLELWYRHAQSLGVAA